MQKVKKPLEPQRLYFLLIQQKNGGNQAQPSALPHIGPTAPWSQI